MKKIISIILLAVIVSTSVLFTGCGGEVAPSNAQTSATAEGSGVGRTDEQVLAGDVDRDSDIDIIDATLIQKIALNIKWH